MTLTEAEAFAKHLAPIVAKHAKEQASAAESRVRAQYEERLAALERRLEEIEEILTRPEVWP